MIVNILSQNHGLCTGYVRSARSSAKNHLTYQNFNLVDFDWSSKNVDALGFFKAEIKKSYLGQIIASKIKLSALSCASKIISENLEQNDNDHGIFNLLLELLEKLNLPDEKFLQEFIKFEINLLGALGYGIDLSSCAATGITDDLHFVSPKSGRAVCFEAGEQYQDKLLILPKFLLEEEAEICDQKDLLNGLKLSGYFIEKYLSKLDKAENDNFNSRKRLIDLLN